MIHTYRTTRHAPSARGELLTELLPCRLLELHLPEPLLH